MKRSRLLLAAGAALAVVAGIVVSSVVSPASAANILTNPGFESGMSGWTCTGGFGSTVTSPVHSGSNALRGAASASDTARCSQTVTVKPSTAYNLSAWVQGSFVYLGVAGGASTWASPASFSKVAVGFTTAAGQTSVEVFVHGWYGTGNYFADDVNLDGPGGPTDPAPGTPGKPAVGAVTNSSVALSWTGATGTVTGYRVYEGNDVKATVTGTSTTITGLATCSNHTYTVAAYNSAGESPKSASTGATTTGCGTGVPGTPGKPTIGTVGNSSIALSWTGATGTVTGYRVYEGNNVKGTVTGTATQINGLVACSSHTFTVAAYNSAGESPKSAGSSATTTGCTNPGLPKHALIGYLHSSFANGSGYIKMADVPAAWDIINLSFGEPFNRDATSGDIRFDRCPAAECPGIESDADFKAAIAAKQAQGKRVLLSIGGQYGVVSLTTTGARDKFVQTVGGIIDKWGLDGLDIDFEGHSLYLNANDRDVHNPTTPVIVNLIAALKSLKTKYGSKFVLTMAPETFFVQVGYQFYGGSDGRAGAYLPVIDKVRDFLTVLHVQNYNSGPIMGLDGQWKMMDGTAQFHIAMTDMVKAGFPVANTGQTFAGLRDDQIAFGTPAAVSAGGGFTPVAQVQQAVTCLVKNQNCGGYTLRGGASPNFRGLMTWSINWDRFYNWEFATNHDPFLSSLP